MCARKQVKLLGWRVGWEGGGRGSWRADFLRVEKGWQASCRPPEEEEEADDEAIDWAELAAVVGNESVTAKDCAATMIGRHVEVT